MKSRVNKLIIKTFQIHIIAKFYNYYRNIIKKCKIPLIIKNIFNILNLNLKKFKKFFKK